MALVTKYIIFTKEELDLWQEDSLKFFLNMKYQSNEIKGNYLRERAKNLIASIRLRFDPYFEEFCIYLHD
jgi:hypothetical protein